MFLLILCLTLPSPALALWLRLEETSPGASALRPTIERKVESGLEEALLPVGLEEQGVEWRRGPARFAVATILGEYARLGVENAELYLEKDVLGWLGRDFREAIRRIIAELPRGPKDLERQPASPLTRRSFVKATTAVAAAGLTAGWLAREKPDAQTQTSTLAQPLFVSLPATPEIDVKKRAVQFYAILEELLAIATRNNSNKDAPDRLLRLLLEGYGTNRWMKLSSDEKERFTKILAEKTLHPEEIWERAGQAGGFDGRRAYRFLQQLNARPYDGKYADVFKDNRFVEVPWEIIMGQLLKETDSFDAAAVRPNDGHGLMQINRTTAFDLAEIADKEGLMDLLPEELRKKSFSDYTWEQMSEVLKHPLLNVHLGILQMRERLARLHHRIPGQARKEDRSKAALFAYNRGEASALGMEDHDPGAKAYRGLVGGAIETARERGEKTLDFDTISAYYRTPISYHDADGNSRVYKMGGDEFAIGMDYVEVIWATARALRILYAPQAPAAPPAGLEEWVDALERFGIVVFNPTEASQLDVTHLIDLIQTLPPHLLRHLKGVQLIFARSPSYWNRATQTIQLAPDEPRFTVYEEFLHAIVDRVMPVEAWRDFIDRNSFRYVDAKGEVIPTTALDLQTILWSAPWRWEKRLVDLQGQDVWLNIVIEPYGISLHIPDEMRSRENFVPNLHDYHSAHFSSVALNYSPDGAVEKLHLQHAFSKPSEYLVLSLLAALKIDGAEDLSEYLDLEFAHRFLSGLEEHPASIEMPLQLQEAAKEIAGDRIVMLTYQEKILKQFEAANPGITRRIEKILMTDPSKLKEGVDYDGLSGDRSHILKLQKPMAVAGGTFGAIKIKGTPLPVGEISEYYNVIQHAKSLGYETSEGDPVVHQIWVDVQGFFRTRPRKRAPMGGILHRDAQGEYKGSLAAFQAGEAVGLPIAHALFQDQRTDEGESAGAVILGIPEEADETRMERLISNLGNRYHNDIRQHLEKGEETPGFLRFLDHFNTFPKLQGYALRHFNQGGFFHMDPHFGNLSIIQNKIFFHDGESILPREGMTDPQFFGYLLYGLRNTLRSARRIEQHEFYGRLKPSWTKQVLQAYFHEFEDNPLIDQVDLDKLDDFFRAGETVPLYKIDHPLVRLLHQSLSGLEEQVQAQMFVVVGPTAFSEIPGLKEALEAIRGTPLAQRVIELPADATPSEVAGRLMPIMESGNPVALCFGSEADAVLAKAKGMLAHGGVPLQNHPPEALAPLVRWVNQNAGQATPIHMERAAQEFLSTIGLEEAA